MDFINEKIKTHQVTQNKNTNGNHDDPEDDLLEQLAILKAMFQKQNKNVYCDDRTDELS